MRSQLFKSVQFFILTCMFCSSAFADGMPESAKPDGDSVTVGSSPAPSHPAKCKGAKCKEEMPVFKSKSPTLNDKDLLPYQYCGKDSDCMQVINGCCQCMQGDKYVAINKDRLEAFQARFNCENMQCPKEEPFSYSCEEGVISCLNHRCIYAAPGEQEPL